MHKEIYSQVGKKWCAQEAEQFKEVLVSVLYTIQWKS